MVKGEGLTREPSPEGADVSMRLQASTRDSEPHIPGMGMISTTSTHAPDII